MQFMLVLDDNVVGVALPSLRAELGFTPPGLAWVVNAYFLAFGGLLLLSGRLADLLGRRRVFLIGVALFGAASLACGLAQEPWHLVAGRFVQGTGAAMASPAALSLLSLLYPGVEERAKALSIWGGIAALGGTTGLVIAGVLTDFLSWRWIFLVNLPVVALALVLLPRLTPESRASGRTRLDVPGTLLGTASVVSLVYGVLEEEAVALVASGVLAVAFLVVESRVAEPLVPLRFLADRTRAVANGVALPFSAAFFAMAFLVMLHLQTGLGYGPLQTGLAYMPFAAGFLTGMRISTRAMTRVGLRPPLVAGFLVASAGLLLLSGAAAGDSYVTGVLPGMLVTSLGAGLAMPVLTAAALTGTTADDAGLGSGLFGSVQQIGGAIGVAVLVQVATGAGHAGGSTGLVAGGFSTALTVAAGLVACAAVLTAVLLRTRSGS
ncbi:MFS transporter [Nonomuraea longicatena]